MRGWRSFRGALRIHARIKKLQKGRFYIVWLLVWHYANCYPAAFSTFKGSIAHFPGLKHAEETVTTKHAKCASLSCCGESTPVGTKREKKIINHCRVQHQFIWCSYQKKKIITLLPPGERTHQIFFCCSLSFCFVLANLRKYLFF